MTKNKLDDPTKLTKDQKKRARRFIDFDNQKKLIKYLIDNDFLKVDI